MVLDANDDGFTRITMMKLTTLAMIIILYLENKEEGSQDDNHAPPAGQKLR